MFVGDQELGYRLTSPAPCPPLSCTGAVAAAGCGGDDAKGKATQLLDVYALKIQMLAAAQGAQIRSAVLAVIDVTRPLAATADFKALAAAHAQAVAVMRSAVPHPAILGVIHECGGRLRMPDRRWEDARVEFLAAFKASEAGERGDACSSLPQALPYSFTPFRRLRRRVQATAQSLVCATTSWQTCSRRAASTHLTGGLASRKPGGGVGWAGGVRIGILAALST